MPKYNEKSHYLYRMMILIKMTNYESQGLLDMVKLDTKLELKKLINSNNRWVEFVSKNMKKEFVDEINAMMNDPKLLHLQAAIYPLSQLPNSELEPLVDEIEKCIIISDKTN
jgi:hypothetical protein